MLTPEQLHLICAILNSMFSEVTLTIIGKVTATISAIWIKRMAILLCTLTNAATGPISVKRTQRKWEWTFTSKIVTRFHGTFQEILERVIVLVTRKITVTMKTTIPLVSGIAHLLILAIIAPYSWY